MKNNALFALLILAFCTVDCSDENPYKQGAVLYEYYCATCHMEAGQGLRGLFPPLADSDYYREHLDEIPCLIRKGIEGEIVVNGRTYNQAMAPIKEINPIEIANIINFINREWYTDMPFLSPADVRKKLIECGGANWPE